VNWRAYGLQQSKDSLPAGPYVFAISVVSPFIKFKNASKETIDSSEELVEEIRRALMQAGQKLSRHIRKESKEADLERKIAHIEQFGPILIEYLGKIAGAKEGRKKKAEEGLRKLLGRDAQAAEKDLSDAELRLQALKEKQAKAGLLFSASAKDDDSDAQDDEVEIVEIEVGDEDSVITKTMAKSKSGGGHGRSGKPVVTTVKSAANTRTSAPSEKLKGTTAKAATTLTTATTAKAATTSTTAKAAGPVTTTSKAAVVSTTSKASK
jgi:DNA topoisomerase-6 subunit B